MISDQDLEQLKRDPSKKCVFFIGSSLLIHQSTKTSFLPFQETLAAIQLSLLHLIQDQSLIICKGESELPSEVIEEKNYSLVPVKQFLAQSDSSTQSMLFRALHWLNWEIHSRYCGQCGSALEHSIGTTEKKCLSCKVSFFPRFSPAVMVLIQHEDKILLARSPHFNAGLYSLIAGFIDVGETAEQAAHREVKEELGIEITDLEYFSTQTWPFPDSFMIAFKAKYHRGELKMDTVEIEDAQWFEANNLPQLPSHASIARQLIDKVLEEICSKNKRE
jgi:NAD+ diphosphatase